MTWEIFVAILGVGVSLIAVMTPIVRLNSTITKLNCSIETMTENNVKRDNRLDAHSKELDDHEHRITVLETEHGSE